MIGFILRMIALIFLGSLYKTLLKPDLIKDLFISQSGYVEHLRETVHKAEFKVEEAQQKTGMMLTHTLQTIRNATLFFHLGMFFICLVVVPNNLYKFLAAIFLVTTTIEHVMMTHLYQGKETKAEMYLDRVFCFFNYIGYPIIILGLLFLH